MEHAHLSREELEREIRREEIEARNPKVWPHHQEQARRSAAMMRAELNARESK